VKYVKVTWLGK